MFFVCLFVLTLQQVLEDWGKRANHRENAFRQFHIPVLRLKLRDISHLSLWQCFQRLGVFLSRSLRPLLYL